MNGSRSPVIGRYGKTSPGPRLVPPSPEAWTDLVYFNLALRSKPGLGSL